MKALFHKGLLIVCAIFIALVSLYSLSLVGAYERGMGYAGVVIAAIGLYPLFSRRSLAIVVVTAAALIDILAFHTFPLVCASAIIASIAANNLPVVAREERSLLPLLLYAVVISVIYTLVIKIAQLIMRDLLLTRHTLNYLGLEVLVQVCGGFCIGALAWFVHSKNTVHEA